MWRANGNPNPCNGLDGILHVQGRFKCRFDPPPTRYLSGPGGPKTLKAEEHIFEN